MIPPGRKKGSLLFLVSIIVVPLPPVSIAFSQTTFHVSPAGNDRWSGFPAEPNASRTDGPFETPEGAKNAVRSVKSKGMPQGGITVLIRQGVYRFTQSLSLQTEDSGEENAPIMWRSFPGETAIFSGGNVVAGFRRISDSSALGRLNPGAGSHILVSNLKHHGITDYGTIRRQGGPGLEFFFRGRRMKLARWPNSGWLRVADVPQSGDSLYNKGLERERRFNGVPVGRHYGRISYEGDRPARWKDPGTVFLHGFWTWDWSDSFQRVLSIDTAQREITLAEPHHHYGYTKNQRYYVLNVLEELDSPGEWFLDRRTGELYFWPPDPVDEVTGIVSLLEDPLLVLDSTASVTIRGITFEHSRGEGVRITGGYNNLVAGCTFRLLGEEAMVIEGGTGNGVAGSDLFDLSRGAIRLTGGNRKTLTPGRNFVHNNHVHHFSQWLRTGQYGVFIDGVANRVSHNKIHDAPFEAMYLRGNEHLIEFNEIHDVMQETGDAGAIHTGRDWTWRGNILRYNYFHHLVGPGLHGAMATYLDDWASGFTIYGNVFYRAGRAAFIGGGRNNTVENNIFIECAPSVHIDARGLGWAGYYFDGTFPWLFERMDDMKFREPPYSLRYPELLELYDDEPRVPKGNKIIRNVSFGGRWMDVYDYGAFDFSVVTVKDNLIADTDVLRRRKRGQEGWDPYYLDIDRKEGYDLYKAGDPQMLREFHGNEFFHGDPGFVDFEGGNFQLSDGSAAYRLGFKKIPVERIGLIRDELRTENAQRSSRKTGDGRK